jgi:hypothetical protein
MRKYMIAASVIIGVCELGYCYLGARLYQEFGYVEPLVPDLYIILTTQLKHTLLLVGEFTRKSELTQKSEVSA